SRSWNGDGSSELKSCAMVDTRTSMTPPAGPSFMKHAPDWRWRDHRLRFITGRTSIRLATTTTNETGSPRVNVKSRLAAAAFALLALPTASPAQDAPSALTCAFERGTSTTYASGAFAQAAA